MADKRPDHVDFDDVVALALARAADGGEAPRPEVKARLMAQLGVEARPLPAGYRFNLEAGADWQPHPVPGIRMRVLSLDRQREYATLLLDVAPGTHFPPHHHDGAEECYIVSGSAYTFGRRMGPGDFLHADAGTDHGELYTDEGCRVILVVRPEDYMV
jgi:anti-sigma factor ChrR (cupin superfamily)